jgi:hypothetical protein
MSASLSAAVGGEALSTSSTPLNIADLELHSIDELVPMVLEFAEDPSKVDALRTLVKLKPELLNKKDMRTRHTPLAFRMALLVT